MKTLLIATLFFTGCSGMRINAVSIGKRIRLQPPVGTHPIPGYTEKMTNPTLRLAATRAELDKAAQVDPRTYPQDMPCINCGHRWMQHKGLLCPIVPGHWSSVVNPLTGLPVAVPPTFGAKLFVPDEAYYKEPDFDVS